MSLLVWLPLNGDLNNQGASLLGVVSAPASVTVANDGKIGKCYTNSGANAGTSNDFNFSASQFSIAAWVRINTRVNSWRCAFKLANSAGDKDYIGFCCEHNTTTTLVGFHFYKTISGTNTAIFDHYPTSINAAVGTWTHLALTYDGKEVKYYQDGVCKQTSAIAAAKQNTIVNTNKLIMFGSDGSRSTAAVKHSLNDVRIYDHCLSPAEVHEISQGLVLHYKLDSPYIETSNNLLAVDKSYEDPYDYALSHATSTNAYVNAGTLASSVGNNIVTYSVYITNNSDTTMQVRMRGMKTDGSTWGSYVNGNTIAAGTSGWAEVTLDMTDTSVYNGTSIYVRWQLGKARNTITGNALFYHAQLEVRDHRSPWTLGGTTRSGYVQDSSGYGHNGTIGGTPTLGTSEGRYNVQTNFTANNQYIQCNSLITSGFGNSYTFAWWGKKSAAGTMFWGFQNGIRLNGMLNNNLWNTGDSSNNPLYKPGTTTAYSVDATQYHHYAMTGNGTKCYVYVDGVLAAEAKTYKSISGTNLFINGWNSETSYSGVMSMSDFRIYCTALSAADVKQLYEVGAKVDNLQNLHTFEIKETNRNLLAGRLWTSPFNNHDPISASFTNFNSKGEYQFTANNTSAGSEYIPINPTGHTYEYDYTISVNAGNQFYIGFERYDANKTARSNNACTYTYATKPSADVIKQHYKGTVNLSTDGTNPCAFIALRILNGWSGTTSGVTGIATIHSFSLREIGTKQQPKLKKTGIFIEEELKEETTTKLHKNGIIETNNLIEL